MIEIFRLKVGSKSLTKLPDLSKLQEKIKSLESGDLHLDGGGAADNVEKNIENNG